MVTFVYFRFLDPSALDRVAPLGTAEVAYFLFAFLALLIAGRSVARHWSRQVIRANGALPGGLQGARLRRRAMRLRVRTRMQAVFLLMSIVPMLLLSVSTFVRVRSLHGADPQAAQAILQNLMLVQAVLVGTGVALAVLLATFLADSVATPLRQLQRAMRGVEQGQLDVSCPVVSNDEICAVSRPGPSQARRQRSCWA